MAAYEKTLADARRRAQAMASETREQQASKAEDTRKRLTAQLDARLAEAEKSIASAKAAAMANVRSIAVDTAGAIVERLVGISPSPKDAADAVSTVLKR
jgi:F-type H+-transporting ATPase subunit b